MREDHSGDVRAARYGWREDERRGMTTSFRIGWLIVVAVLAGGWSLFGWQQTRHGAMTGWQAGLGSIALVAVAAVTAVWAITD